ncbi:hypothetical protein FJZ31_24470 [Candidatus Poribacteria bacterium]|nr:hypothetical protein [Candidatus Poribacteria bacterium]
MCARDVAQVEHARPSVKMYTTSIKTYTMGSKKEYQRHKLGAKVGLSIFGMPIKLGTFSFLAYFLLIIGSNKLNA